MFHTAGHKKKILPSFLCAGYANGMKDSCEVRTYNVTLSKFGGGGQYFHKILENEMLCRLKFGYVFLKGNKKV